MSFFTCCVWPIIILLSILYLCKWSNFSILPRNLKGNNPSKFTFPEVKRDMYKWNDEENNLDYDDGESDEEDSEEDEEFSYEKNLYE